MFTFDENEQECAASFGYLRVVRAWAVDISPSFPAPLARNELSVFQYQNSVRGCLLIRLDRISSWSQRHCHMVLKFSLKILSRVFKYFLLHNL